MTILQLTKSSLSSVYGKNGSSAGMRVPLSTRLGSSDIWLFPDLQPKLKRKRSQDVEDVKRSVKVTLKLIPKEEFHNVSISVSVGRLCVGAEVDYGQGEPPKILRITGDEILQVKMKLCGKTFRNQHSFLRI